MLYTNIHKFDHESQNTLKKTNGVTLKDYDEFYNSLSKLETESMAYDPTKVNCLMVESLPATTIKKNVMDYVYETKACFSDVELDNLRKAHIRDGVAMIKFLHWMDENIENGITEIDASHMLTSFRTNGDFYIEASFETIPAYAGNAAMMHYSADESSPVTIQTKGLFLIDSGGQYYDGTTDITRTIAVGDLTEEEKTDFTLVLKGHIALDRLVFLSGCTGTNIDAIARQPIWEALIDYKSGTGHSIGYVLGVHEGPSRIRMNHNQFVLKPGMVLTNEPGIYKKNKHGIRTENVIVVNEIATNDHGTFLGFETISYCPIDKRCIKKKTY